MSWAKIVPASKHYGLSARTLRNLLKAGMPHSRLPSGTILIELQAGDEWLRSFTVGNADQKFIDQIVKELS